MFCHDQGSSVQSFEFFCREAEEKPEIKARVEESCQRIKSLKDRYLTDFTGVPEKELKNSIGLPRHRGIVKEIQGSL